MEASEGDMLCSGGFQLRNVNGGRLGKEYWVIWGMCYVVVDEVGVYVVLEHCVRWGGGMVLKRAP